MGVRFIFTLEGEMELRGVVVVHRGMKILSTER